MLEKDAEISTLRKTLQTVRVDSNARAVTPPRSPLLMPVGGEVIQLEDWQVLEEASVGNPLVVKALYQPDPVPLQLAPSLLMSTIERMKQVCSVSRSDTD